MLGSWVRAPSRSPPRKQQKPPEQRLSLFLAFAVNPHVQFYSALQAFCSSLEMTFWTLSTSFNDCIISGSIHVKSLTIKAYISFAYVQSNFLFTKHIGSLWLILFRIKLSRQDCTTSRQPQRDNETSLFHILLLQQRTDAVHDVAGVLVGDAGAARQAEAVCINLCRSF